MKALRKENKALKEKLEHKSLEFGHFKTDSENDNKEKNVLSVALKASKTESKKQRKDFEKKNSELEKKLMSLMILSK